MIFLFSLAWAECRSQNINELLSDTRDYLLEGSMISAEKHLDKIHQTSFCQVWDQQTYTQYMFLYKIRPFDFFSYSRSHQPDVHQRYPRER